MIEKGRIVKTDGARAVVAFKRTAACDKCRLCENSKGGLEVTLDVRNTLGANVDDVVEVDVGEVKGTLCALIYLLPVLLCALGAILGNIMSHGAGAILGAAGLGIGLAIAIPIDLTVLRKVGRAAMKSFVPADSDEDDAAAVEQPADVLREEVKNQEEKVASVEENAREEGKIIKEEDKPDDNKAVAVEENKRDENM